MATQNTRTLARWMMAPSVGLLLVWMIVPLAMTLWFSFQNYNLLNPGNVSFAGLFNYQYFYSDPAFFQSIWNTLVIVVGVLDDHGDRRRRDCAAAGSADVGTGARAHPGDLAVLRHAAGCGTWSGRT